MAMTAGTMAEPLVDVPMRRAGNDVVITLDRRKSMQPTFSSTVTAYSGTGGQVGDLGAVRCGNTDAQVHVRGGQSEGDGAHDAQGQPQGAPPEAAAGIVPPAELGND
jgi:hypothetical protein